MGRRLHLVMFFNDKPLVVGGTPSTPARVVAPYAHTLWDAALSAGLTEAQIVQLVGRASVGEEDVSVNVYLDLLNAARLCAGPLFGWQLGQQVKPTTYGVNGILLLACPTLGDALQQVLWFESLVHDLGRSSFALKGDQVVYEWRNDCAGHPAAGALTESVFAGVLTCAKWLVGKPMGSLDLEFSHPAESDTVAAMEQASGAHIRCGMPNNRAIFSADVLAWPIPQANTALLPLLQQHADALLQARHPREGGVVAQVRQSITARLGQGPVKLADVAADLHVSTRTLQRRLFESGLAFQNVLDATRHELALHYLADTAMPVAEVANLLGFQDTPAFHHAFKSWQGQGPSQYRSGAAAEGIGLW